MHLYNVSDAAPHAENADRSAPFEYGYVSVAACDHGIEGMDHRVINGETFWPMGHDSRKGRLLLIHVLWSDPSQHITLRKYAFQLAVIDDKDASNGVAVHCGYGVCNRGF